MQSPRVQDNGVCYKDVTTSYTNAIYQGPFAQDVQQAVNTAILRHNGLDLGKMDYLGATQ